MCRGGAWRGGQWAEKVPLQPVSGAGDGSSDCDQSQTQYFWKTDLSQDHRSSVEQRRLKGVFTVVMSGPWVFGDRFCALRDCRLFFLLQCRSTQTGISGGKLWVARETQKSRLCFLYIIVYRLSLHHPYSFQLHFYKNEPQGIILHENLCWIVLFGPVVVTVQSRCLLVWTTRGRCATGNPWVNARRIGREGQDELTVFKVIYFSKFKLHFCLFWKM